MIDLRSAREAVGEILYGVAVLCRRQPVQVPAVTLAPLPTLEAVRAARVPIGGDGA